MEPTRLYFDRESKIESGIFCRVETAHVKMESKGGLLITYRSAQRFGIFEPQKSNAVIMMLKSEGRFWAFLCMYCNVFWVVWDGKMGHLEHNRKVASAVWNFRTSEVQCSYDDAQV